MSSLSMSLSKTPSISKDDEVRSPAAVNMAKPPDFRSKVLAVGGVSGTYEELTGHKQELRVSMSVWVSVPRNRNTDGTMLTISFPDFSCSLLPLLRISMHSLCASAMIYLGSARTCGACISLASIRAFSSRISSFSTES